MCMGKRPFSATGRTTPSRRRNIAARAKLSTPFGKKIGEVLAKQQDNRKRIAKDLIAELAVASGCNSTSISRIWDAFRAQISGPRLFKLNGCCEAYRRRLAKPLEEV